MESEKRDVSALLGLAGITINGRKEYDITVKDDRFYRRILASGTIGLGESYMDGWWDCPRLDLFSYRIYKAGLEKKARKNLRTLAGMLKARTFNLQVGEGSYEVGRRHYDTGNDLFEAMLDKRMIYSCGYWRNAKTLDKAQEDKLDLICRKLGLKRGERILDIGCGWGGLLKFAAQRYGVSGVGVTVSKEQARFAKANCRGLPIDIRLQDYRLVREKFDHIVSVGMFEHVGDKNYRTYMELAHRCLKDDGLFLLHTIGTANSDNSVDPWLLKYIFPNSMIPSQDRIVRAYDKLFIMEDWQNFGAYYEPTLLSWYRNIERNWKNLKGYDTRFKRMWKYYLLCCAGALRSRRYEVWQIILSKDGVEGGYRSIR